MCVGMRRPCFFNCALACGNYLLLIDFFIVEKIFTSTPDRDSLKKSEPIERAVEGGILNLTLLGLIRVKEPSAGGW